MKTAEEWRKSFNIKADCYGDYDDAEMRGFIEAIQADAQPQWYPIETAPKDCSKILLSHPEWVCSAEGGWHEGVGSWKEDFLRYTGDISYGSHLPRCDYWGYGLDNINPFNKEMQPTHWMPLPVLPPKE